MNNYSMCASFLKRQKKIGGEQEEENGERERGEERRKEGKKIENGGSEGGRPVDNNVLSVFVKHLTLVYSLDQ